MVGWMESPPSELGAVERVAVREALDQYALGDACTVGADSFVTAVVVEQPTSPRCHGGMATRRLGDCQSRLAGRASHCLAVENANGAIPTHVGRTSHPSEVVCLLGPIPARAGRTSAGLSFMTFNQFQKPKTR